jgi:hypothetical protein
LDIHHDVPSSDQLLVKWINQGRVYAFPELSARARKEDVELSGCTCRLPDRNVAVAIVSLNDVRTNSREVVTSELARAPAYRGPEWTESEAAEWSGRWSLAFECA